MAARASALICAAMFGLLLIAKAAEATEFSEEVELIGGHKIIVKRKELYEPRITGLRVRETYIGSVLSIVDGEVPSWNGTLHPIYIDKSEEGAYLLVATIPNSAVCYQRGRPKSIYVAFIGDKRGWRETQLPKDVDGRAANLLLLAREQDLKKRPVTVEVKRRLNEVLRVDPRMKVIRLDARFGC